jgi:toxin YoeB
VISEKNILFDEQAENDLAYWYKKNLKKVARIYQLLDSIRQDPFSGIGKPEPLRYHLSGCWSRRIDHENRLVYEVKAEIIRIISCRYHY